MIIIIIIPFQLICGDICLLQLHFFVSISVDGFCLFQINNSIISYHSFLNHSWGTTHNSITVADVQHVINKFLKNCIIVYITKISM